jgi:2-furoyl-CoA dehydrogenase large subunit
MSVKIGIDKEKTRAPAEPSKKWVGQSVRRHEDPRLLTGRGTFLDDVKIANVHHAAILRSPYGHARIKRIDMSRALALDGVVAGLAGGEVKERTRPFAVVATAPIQYYCMAIDKARFVGEPVAAVVARDRYLAEDALELIDVEYEPLPAIVDPEKALEADAPILHENIGSNLACHRLLDYGDVDAAFEQADMVLTERLVFPRYTSMPLETYGVVSSYDPFDGGLTVWSNFMGPFIMHPITARALDIPENRLRFIVPTDIGGSFGIKTSIYPYLTLIGLLSMKTNVPVKWIEDRREHLLASSIQTDRVTYREVAVKRDGRVLAVRTRLFDNVGAYLRTPEPATTFRPIGNYVGPYQVRNLRIDASVVMTNKCPTGPNRAYGCQHLYFEQERLMDKVATALELDPADVRMRNFIPSDAFPYTTPTGGVYDSGDYPKAFQLALDMFAYKERRELQKKARSDGRFVGIGIATGVDPSVSNMGYLTVALDPEVRRRPDYLPKSGAMETATVKMDPLGNVTVFLCTTPQGQGHETIISQIVADEIGITPDDVTVIDECDTAKNIWSISSGTYSSRFASVGTSAVAAAARTLRAKIDRIAAHLLGIRVEDVHLEKGSFQRRGHADRSIRLSHVAGTAHWNPRGLPEGMEVGLHVTETFSFTGAKSPDQQDRVNSSNTYGFMADICEVDVDVETGAVKILKYVSVHDAGTIINPKIVEGQIYGGAFHGIAGALYEEQVYDENGQCLTATLVDYECPYSTEAPKLDIGHIETPSPLTPLGSKGAGESSSETAPACIANAVADALAPLGINITELPLTPRKVWELVQAAKGKSA